MELQGVPVLGKQHNNLQWGVQTHMKMHARTHLSI